MALTNMNEAMNDGSFSFLERDEKSSSFSGSGSIDPFDGHGGIMTMGSDVEESLTLIPYMNDYDGSGGRGRKKSPGKRKTTTILATEGEGSASETNEDENIAAPTSSASSKKRIGWFSRFVSNKQSESDVDDSHVSMSNTDADGDDGDRIYDNADATSAYGMDPTEGQSTLQSVTSKMRDTRNIETIPNCETEYHELIRLHDWEELEILLKEYDFELYKKPPPKPKKKQAKKLRVAKYLPEMPKFTKEKVVPVSPLLGLDALGRTPLHLCCVEPVPSKLLTRILNSARDAAAVKDATESLPIHLAIQNERSVEVVDNLVRRYFQGSWTADGRGRTPLIWAVEVAKKRQEEENIKPTNTYWGFPSSPEDVAWQERQTKLWEVVQFLMKNRNARRKKLLPAEHGQIVAALGQSAPPDVISLMITTGKAAFKKESIGSKGLFFMISRQYPIWLLEKLLGEMPKGFAKLQKDGTGRGVVSAHYRVGCISNQSDSTNKRSSFRVTMQNLANAQNDLHEKVTPSAQYSEWWEKLKLLINLWGTHSMDEDEPDYFHEDELLLHNALSNSDAPPSLIQLLASLYPDSPELEHPKSRALPIHLACRIWRFRSFPPRRGEKEIKMGRISSQLIESDPSRTRKRYKDRLPIHHAIATGKPWDFVKPLVIYDRKSLHVRDPITKIYPFQMAALHIDRIFDVEVLAQQAFAPAVWKKMPDYQKDHEMRKVEYHYDLEQLGLIYELLKHSPDAISHNQLVLESAAKRALGIQRRKASEMFVEASDDVVSATQMKLVRAMFGLNHVSGHFIGWCYENTARGWKTHRRNFAVLKEAVMDGFVPIQMDRWWKKLKFWLWYDCPWKNIPRRDEYLLHCALCNPDVSPWIIELILECFPRSSTIPLPDSNGCYPLHIACVTAKYNPRPFEFSNSKNVIEMVASMFHDAMLLKWDNQLPLHLAIANSRQWEDLRFMAEDEPVSLAIPHPETDFFPFQFAALHRPYTKSQRQAFETEAIETVGKDKWKRLSPTDKVGRMKAVLEKHEPDRLGTIFELLRKNPMLVSVGLVDSSKSRSKKKSKQQEFGDSQISTPQWLSTLDANLSIASLEFLDEIYTAEHANASRHIKTVSSTKSPKNLDSALKSSDASHALQRPVSVAQEKTRTPTLNENKPVIIDDEFENVIYEEYEVTFDDDSIKRGTLEVHSVESAGGEWNKIELVPSNPLAANFFDHPGLLRVRRKNLIVVTRSSAFVVPSTAGPTDAAFKILSEARTNTNFWLKTLKAIGEKIDLAYARGMRHKSDQVVVSGFVVGDLMLFLDEDETNIWLLCGMDALSLIEGYDIGIAVELEQVFADKHTRNWLTDYEDALKRTDVAPQSDYEVLTAVLEAMETKQQPNMKNWELTVSKSMFRDAIDAPVDSPEYSPMLTKVIFAVAFEKLESRFSKLKPVPVRYQTSRALRFEVTKERFYQSQKKVKFLKNLKRMQRGAKTRRRKPSDRPSKHFDGLNQPQQRQGEEDVISLATNDLFDESVGVQAAKPLLAAAHQAKEQLKQKKLIQSADHWNGLNQPRDTEDDSKSIDMDDLWTKELSIPPSKRLLAAAIAAREISQQQQWTEGEHLNATHQPSDDSTIMSIDHDDLFEQAKGALPARPLLTAALKAREESKQKTYTKKGWHLRGLNQPNKKLTDDMSIDESDLFLEKPNRDPPAKPLLSAAYQAREACKQEQFSKHGEHLSNLNQPKAIFDIDANSIDEDDLFNEGLRILPPANALKFAAVKAKQEFLERKLVATHLQNTHQPSSTYDDDNVSITQVDELFDGRRDSLPARPIMTAALIAREQSKEEGYRKADHLRHLNQPKTSYSDDTSISEDILAQENADPIEITRKPLLTAAYKAREQRRADVYRSRGNGSNIAHVQFAHQPRSVREEDDSMSLGLSDVFESSGRQALNSSTKKPLLAAAKKAKEERDTAMMARGSYQSIGRPNNKSRHQNKAGSGYKLSIPDESASLTVSDLFDRSKGEFPSKGESPKKPLLAAAIKAKEERDVAERGQGEGWSDSQASDDDPAARTRVRRRTSMSANLVRKNSLEIKKKPKLSSSVVTPPKKSKRKKSATSTTDTDLTMNSPPSGTVESVKGTKDRCPKAQMKSSSSAAGTSSPSITSPDRDNLMRGRSSLFGRRSKTTT